MSATGRRLVRSICLLGCIAGICGVAGCRTAALSPEGAHVATSQSAPIDQGYPPSACRSLGYVVGRGGGSFGGAWISNEQLVKYAMNNLQNEVAKLGGNFVQHDTPQLGVSGDKNGTSTTTATVSGTAYFCDPAAKGQATSSPPPPATAAASPAVTATPEGAGGFKFAEAAAESQKACAAAGHTWKRSGDDAECSDTLVSVGAPARALLHFCTDTTCGVDLVISPAADQVLAKYDELYSSLEKRYGIPKQGRAVVSPDCAKALAGCLAAPSAPGGAAWRWPDGNVVALRLALAANSPIIEVSYANPTRTKNTTPGPAL